MSELWTPKEEQSLKEHLMAKPKRQYVTIADLMGRTTDSIRNKVFSLRQENRHEWMQEERIAFFDIEASNLKANIGNMISYAIKPLGKPVKYNGWTRREAISRNLLDRRLMRDLIEDLKNVDLLVTFFGTGFDLKFIRTRAMMLFGPGDGGFPTFGQIKHFDVYYAVRGRMQLYNSRLATATAALGIEGKTPLPASLWTDARLGYPDAMKEIKTHNIEDTQILEELYLRLIPYVKIIRKSI